MTPLTNATTGTLSMLLMNEEAIVKNVVARDAAICLIFRLFKSPSEILIPIVVLGPSVITALDSVSDWVVSRSSVALLEWSDKEVSRTDDVLTVMSNVSRRNPVFMFKLYWTNLGFLVSSVKAAAPIGLNGLAATT